MMLEAKNLYVGYKGRYGIGAVNLSFEPGKIYSIVGKNGSGKSTLLKSLSGQQPPEIGTVLLEGKELYQYALNERMMKVSYLSQGNAVPNVTVEQLLSQVRFPYQKKAKLLLPEDWSAVYRALGDMKAAGFLKDSMRMLSNGEQQRVYLAMQLAQNADILLLDEPTTYLDIEYQLILMEHLKKLKQQGKTVIMVMNDLQLALKYSDQIIAVDAGKEIFTGTPKSLLENGTLKKVFHIDVAKLVSANAE